jgi:hypothetical protein
MFWNDDLLVVFTDESALIFMQSDDAIVSMLSDPIVVVVYLTCGFLIIIWRLCLYWW